MSDSPTELGELEGAIMQLVWSHGSLTAEIARQQLGRPLKESTIRTVLRRLEDKGWVSHTVEGRTFVYRAAEPRATTVRGQGREARHRLALQWRSRRGAR